MSTPTCRHPTPAPAASAPASAPRTARERVREEMTAEILAVAGAHVAREGAAALSLRSVARDLGMAPSALYRYFDGRDALLSALILGAYEALATEAERAADRAERDVAPGRPATPSGGWPCPAPCARGPSPPPPVGADLRHPGAGLPGARGHGRALRPEWRRRSCARWSRRRRRAGSRPGAETQPVSDGAGVRRWRRSATGSFPSLPVEKVVLALEAWTTIVGTISLEVFGHWRNTVLDPGAALRGRSSAHGSPRRSACTERSRRVGYAAERHRRRRLQRRLRAAPGPAPAAPRAGPRGPTRPWPRRGRRPAQPARPAPCRALPA